MSLLQAQNLRVSIGHKEILKGIDLEIGEGEIFGIVGESGSGKSMTSLALMDLLPGGAKRSGSVTFNGRDHLSLSETEMCEVRGKELGMVFQEPMTALNPLMTIGEQITETMIVHGRYNEIDAKRIAIERLTRVEMPPSKYPLNLYPHELSGGQRQRICIAMAIALHPKLLIADEPTTALDVSTQAQILRLLNELVLEEKMSMILITHDLAVIANMSKNICLMKDGEILDKGPTEEVFREKAHPYMRTLLEASTLTPSRISKSKSKPILKVGNVVRAYPIKKIGFFERKQFKMAVNQVSFLINQGESVGLVGESGCGKSTLTRAILGLDPLLEGYIEIDGTKIEYGSKIPHSLRRKIQVVFQDPYGSFNPRHKVRRLICEPFYLNQTSITRSEKEKLAQSVLRDVGLSPSDLNKYINEFSGGQRQRIAIARALILKPEIIILDEAVSALDASIRSQILELLASLQDDYNLTYIFISHDLNVVRAVTDRVLVMENGKIVEEGRTENIFNSPQHPYTCNLLEATPFIPEEWMK